MGERSEHTEPELDQLWSASKTMGNSKKTNKQKKNTLEAMLTFKKSIMMGTGRVSGVSGF